MLSLFRAARYTDPVLGTLKYSRGLWRGVLVVDGSPVALAVSGSRSTPSAAALSLARSAQAHLASCRGVIEAELYSHYLGYADAVALGELEPVGPLPVIQPPSGVWAHVSPEFVAVVPLDGRLATELGYVAAWEEEHTLGVRLQDGAFVELCGSSVAP